MREGQTTVWLTFRDEQGGQAAHSSRPRDTGEENAPQVARR